MNINPTFSPALDLLLFLASDYASMYHRAGWTNSSSPIIYAYSTAGHRRFSFFGKALGIDLWNCFVIFFCHWMSLWETRSRFAVTLYILRTITVVYFKNDFVFAKIHFIFEKVCPVFKIRFYVMISSLNFVHQSYIRYTCTISKTIFAMKASPLLYEVKNILVLILYILCVDPLTFLDNIFQVEFIMEILSRLVSKQVIL